LDPDDRAGGRFALLQALLHLEAHHAGEGGGAVGGQAADIRNARAGGAGADAERDAAARPQTLAGQRALRDDDPRRAVRVRQLEDLGHLEPALAELALRVVGRPADERGHGESGVRLGRRREEDHGGDGVPGAERHERKDESEAEPAYRGGGPRRAVRGGCAAAAAAAADRVSDAPAHATRSRRAANAPSTPVRCGRTARRPCASSSAESKPAGGRIAYSG